MMVSWPATTQLTAHNLVSNWCQSAPIRPVMPSYNRFTFNNLGFNSSMAWSRWLNRTDAGRKA
jgi:hypothetical protein